MTKKLTVVVSEDRTARPTDKKLQTLLGAYLGPRAEIDLTVLPHLYDLAPDGPGMDFLRSVDGDLLVLAWLYPRAAHWLLDANRVRGRMGRTALFPDEELPAENDAAPAKPGKKAPRPLPDRTLWCVDLRAVEEPRALLSEIDRIAFEATGVEPPQAESPEAEAAVPAEANGIARVDEATHPRWYPVVDYSRCAACLECLNFCLRSEEHTSELQSL